jgi:hypothetical protein
LNLLLDLLINPLAPPFSSLKKFTCPGTSLGNGFSLTGIPVGLTGEVLGITTVGIGSIVDVFVLSRGKSERKFDKLDFKSINAMSYILK